MEDLSVTRIDRLIELILIEPVESSRQEHLERIRSFVQVDLRNEEIDSPHSFTGLSPLESLLDVPYPHSSTNDAIILEVLLSKGADPRKVDEAVWEKFFRKAETAFGGNFITGFCKVLLDNIKESKARDCKRVKEERVEMVEEPPSPVSPRSSAHDAIPLDLDNLPALPQPPQTKPLFETASDIDEFPSVSTSSLPTSQPPPLTRDEPPPTHVCLYLPLPLGTPLPDFLRYFFRTLSIRIEIVDFRTFQPGASNVFFNVDRFMWESGGVLQRITAMEERQPFIDMRGRRWKLTPRVALNPPPSQNGFAGFTNNTTMSATLAARPPLLPPPPPPPPFVPPAPVERGQEKEEDWCRLVLEGFPREGTTKSRVEEFLRRHLKFWEHLELVDEGHERGIVATFEVKGPKTVKRVRERLTGSFYEGRRLSARSSGYSNITRDKRGTAGGGSVQGQEGGLRDRLGNGTDQRVGFAGQGYSRRWEDRQRSRSPRRSPQYLPFGTHSIDLGRRSPIHHSHERINSRRLSHPLSLAALPARPIFPQNRDQTVLTLSSDGSEHEDTRSSRFDSSATSISAQHHDPVPVSKESNSPRSNCSPPSRRSRVGGRTIGHGPRPTIPTDAASSYVSNAEDFPSV
ncbi:hypothetical protein JCM16303_006907 [Sporobolomyces ruberrimus]